MSHIRDGRQNMLLLTFIIVGYLSGSILYAKIFGWLFKHEDITLDTKDHNPGTANAFMKGGFVCGTLTLICELLKGFFPVYFYCQLARHYETPEFGLAFVLLAPVLGHAFPFLHAAQGGKGIAVTFGSLLGAAPGITAALVLAFFFLMFSLVIRVSPHIYRTAVTYVCAALFYLCFGKSRAVKLGFFLMSMVVIRRLAVSREEKGKCEVKFLWMP